MNNIPFIYIYIYTHTHTHTHTHIYIYIHTHIYNIFFTLHSEFFSKCFSIKIYWIPEKFCRIKPSILLSFYRWRNWGMERIKSLHWDVTIATEYVVTLPRHCMMLFWTTGWNLHLKCRQRNTLQINNRLASFRI